MPADTREALGDHAGKCESRSLYMDRFSCPQTKDDDRRKWFERLIGKKPEKLPRWKWCAALGPGPIYAQLQSRLMVNMAGGVMENAGLYLDRFGVPMIPGSAVKGCARRMAIEILLECREGGASNETLAEALVEVALVFGWTEQDWRPESDFAYALGEKWEGVSGVARSRLPHADSFAGSVCFLPAYPVDGLANASWPASFLKPPAVGKLELDIVTSHHPKYYKKAQPTATDDEDPVPVIFPAVAAGHMFAFHVWPLRKSGLVGRAQDWLKKGLEMFGLGAKTNAGYGWFDCSDTLQSTVCETLERQKERERQQTQERKEAAEKKQREEEAHRKREEEKRILENMTEEQREDHDLARKNDQQFQTLLDKFLKQPSETQKAVIRALRKDPSIQGSRREFWDVLKKRSGKKGGRHARVEQEIRRLSKQIYPGTEGKMP